MKLALGFNPILNVSEQAKVAANADAAGYDSIWMHQSVFQRDVVTYISAMAGATSRIRIGSGVINTFRGTRWQQQRRSRLFRSFPAAE